MPKQTSSISEFQVDRLLAIEEPFLVERYDEALKGFGLPASGLDSFHIDMCGYSPEVAEKLGNEQYLDPNDVNRRFIILSPEQARLSVARETFSNTGDLMAEFFRKNLKPIHALTIKDVIYGEIEDNVFEIDHIDDLLDIEQVEFQVSTPRELPAKTSRLKLLMDRVLKEPDAWQDDKLLKEMVALAKETGDIRDNELLPSELVFRHETFWAAHFGGIYIFNDDEAITVVCDADARGFRKSRPWQVSYLDIGDEQNVYRFLAHSGRLDPPRGSWIETSGLIQNRFVMAVAWRAAQTGGKGPRDWMDLGGAMRWVKNNPGEARRDPVLQLLQKTAGGAANWSSIDMDRIEPELRFALCRANPEHPDMELINRLIGEYLPFDYMQKLIFHPGQFRKQWALWPEEFKKFVANGLGSDYFKLAKAYQNSTYG